ncbi:MAG: PqqD family protein [Acidaminococcaceae bacterium]|nr:PqqD family protein [Acidaminococcaceae bacterium]
MSCVDPVTTEDAILDRLAVLYTADQEEMRPDVAEFLADMVEKGVLIAK